MSKREANYLFYLLTMANLQSRDNFCLKIIPPLEKLILGKVSPFKRDTILTQKCGPPQNDSDAGIATCKTPLGDLSLFINQLTG